MGRVENAPTLNIILAIVTSTEGWTKIYGHNAITIYSENGPYIFGFQVI